MAAPKARNAACRVLVILLYGTSKWFGIDKQTGDISIYSIRGLARSLSMDSYKMNRHIDWLERMGYVTHMKYADNRRSVRLRLREVVNVR